MTVSSVALLERGLNQGIEDARVGDASEHVDDEGGGHRVRRDHPAEGELDSNAAASMTEE
jgi:hypothetical protein